MAAVKAGSIKTEKLTAKKLKIAIEDLPVSRENLCGGRARVT